MPPEDRSEVPFKLECRQEVGILTTTRSPTPSHSPSSCTTSTNSDFAQTPDEVHVRVQPPSTPPPKLQGTDGRPPAWAYRRRPRPKLTAGDLLKHAFGEQAWASLTELRTPMATSTVEKHNAFEEYCLSELGSDASYSPLGFSSTSEDSEGPFPRMRYVRPARGTFISNKSSLTSLRGKTPRSKSHRPPPLSNTITPSSSKTIDPTMNAASPPGPDSIPLSALFSYSVELPRKREQLPDDAQWKERAAQRAEDRAKQRAERRLRRIALGFRDVFRPETPDALPMDYALRITEGLYDTGRAYKPFVQASCSECNESSQNASQPEIPVVGEKERSMYSQERQG